MNPSLGVGLVGLGIHGERYARHLLAGEVQGAHLAAVCRADAVAGSGYARRHGLDWASTPEELMALPGVDLVMVVTPPDAATAYVAAALEGARPVLVEKPLAHTVPAGRRLAGRAQELGVPLMVAQTLRWNHVVHKLRGEMASVGTPVMLSLNQRFEPAHRPWLDVPGPGGILLNTGIHSFDLLRHLTGREVEEVRCVTDRVTTSRTDDLFVAVLRLTGGLTAVVENCRATGGRSGRIEVAGAGGQLVGDHVQGRLERITAQGSESLDCGDDVPTVAAAMNAFVTAVRAGSPMPVSATEGLRALEVVEAAQRAAETDRPVVLTRT